MIDQNYLFGSFEITSIRLYTPLRNTLRNTLSWLPGVYNLIEVISSRTEQKFRSILYNILFDMRGGGESGIPGYIITNFCMMLLYAYYLHFAQVKQPATPHLHHL